jgi:hypothetical protein
MILPQRELRLGLKKRSARGFETLPGSFRPQFTPFAPRRASSRLHSSMEDVPMLIWIGIATAWVACLAVVVVLGADNGRRPGFGGTSGTGLVVEIAHARCGPGGQSASINETLTLSPPSNPSLMLPPPSPRRGSPRCSRPPGAWSAPWPMPCDKLSFS